MGTKMTPEKAAEHVTLAYVAALIRYVKAEDFPDCIKDMVIEQIRAAVVEEREACAVVAEIAVTNEVRVAPYDRNTPGWLVATEIAEAIRARTE